MLIRGLTSVFIAISSIGCESQNSPIVSANLTAIEEKSDSAVIAYPIADLLGKIDPMTHEDFVKIPIVVASKNGMWMRREALGSFIKMHESAASEGIQLRIISATRPFNHQKRIWEGKWNGSRKVEGSDLSQTIPDPAERARKILEYSSMPGTSRHHWGTDIDLNSLNNSYFETGKGKKTYDWLKNNANQFGYCQVYTEKGPNREHGYEMEKWHWSFMPTSSRMMADYNTMISTENFGGFDGDKAINLEEVLRYVSGIDQSCTVDK